MKVMYKVMWRHASKSYVEVDHTTVPGWPDPCVLARAVLTKSCRSELDEMKRIVWSKLGDGVWAGKDPNLGSFEIRDLDVAGEE